MATRGTGGLTTPPPRSEVLLQAEGPTDAENQQQQLRLSGGWVAKTARGAKQKSLTQ